MEEQSNLVSISTIQPKYVFGLRNDIKGNIHFTTKQEVVYPVAGVLTIHDYTLNKQKFLRIGEHINLEVISISPNRKLLAVAERNEKCWINIYDITTIKKKKTLYFPSEVPIPEPECMSFTYDSKALAVLSKEPDAFLTIFYFDKSDTVVTARVSNGNQKALTANCVACNLTDTGLVAIGGNFTFKLMSRQERGFTLLGTLSGKNKIIKSITWLTADVLVAGTSDNKLIFIEGGDPKCEFEADQVEIIDLSRSKEADNIEDDRKPETQNSLQSEQLTKTTIKNVNCLTYFQKGFAFAIHNILYVFESDLSFCYMKKTIVTIPMDLYDENLYCIKNVAINAEMDTVIVTSNHSQIYIGMLFVPETLKIMELTFKPLGEPLHINGIIDIDICLWKSIIMTTSKDQTIRVWNYETGKIELVKKYQVDITVIGLHPSGLFAAVGFSDQLRLMGILLDDLKIIKTFNFPKCQQAIFSHNGHFLACAYDNVIAIVSVFSFNIVRTLKGHNGLVLSIIWSIDDYYLISSGEDGAVYKWEVLSGKRISECVQKGTEYRGLALTSDASTIYAVTNTGILREIINSDITREIKPSHCTALTTITLARSDLVMFIGSETGQIYNVQLPFLDVDSGLFRRFFHKSVTKMKVSSDDTLLITGSEDGTLVIWVILNNAGRIAPLDSDLGKCMEIMIPRADLVEKIDIIQSLQLRINQQIAEFQYQIRQGDAFHSEQLRDIHTGYCAAIEELKEKNEKMEAYHIEELNIITANIAHTKEEHSKALMELEAQFHEKIIKEFEKSADIKKKMDDMREDYEIKLRKSAGCLQDTIEALEIDFKKHLTERQQLIQQLMQEMEKKEGQFSEYCHQISLDSDRKMIESRLQYEQHLKEENESMLKWRADAGVLNKQLLSLSTNCDELEKEKNLLKIEHYKSQKIIKNYQKDVAELKKEIDDGNRTIKDKEKRINELQRKTQELEKYKSVLDFKVAELKAQIEPREKEIKEKKDQIIDMEREMENLEQTNLKLELQLNELKDKYRGNESELKLERQQCRLARNHLIKICGDIYNVSKLIQNTEKLKKGVKKIYLKYSNDAELRKSLELDANVQEEFSRHRESLQKLTQNTSISHNTHKSTANKIDKLIKENVTLLTELNQLRSEYKEIQKRNFDMESILGISGKYLPTTVARAKLFKACADFDELERINKEKCLKLEVTINTLTNENQLLREEILKFKNFMEQTN